MSEPSELAWLKMLGEKVLLVNRMRTGKFAWSVATPVGAVSVTIYACSHGEKSSARDETPVISTAAATTINLLSIFISLHLMLAWPITFSSLRPFSQPFGRAPRHPFQPKKSPTDTLCRFNTYYIADLEKMPYLIA
jgi:hypothetical protein